jgi:hypothetical protein
MKEYIHGFVSLDLKQGGVEEYANGQRIVIDQIKLMFDRFEKAKIAQMTLE